MVNRAAYKGEKRQKELARLKKAEEKRQRRLAKRAGNQQDTDAAGDDSGSAQSDASAGEPAENT